MGWKLTQKLLPINFKTDENDICRNDEKELAPLKRKKRRRKTEELVPPGEMPLALSSVYGQLKTIVLFFPTNSGRTVYPYLNFLKEFVQKIGGTSRLFLLVVESRGLISQNEEKTLIKLAQKNHNRFQMVVIDYKSYDISPWAQDSFFPIKYKENNYYKTYLVEPCNTPRNRNIAEKITEYLQNELPLDLGVNIGFQRSPVPFVGGNMLVGSNFILIGLHRTDKNIIKQLGQKWIGKNIIVLESDSTLFNSWIKCKTTTDTYCNKYQADTKHQTIFHLDVFITLAGKNQYGQEVLVFGQPVIGFSITDDLAPDIKALIKDTITETSKAIESMIAKVKEQFNNIGIPYKIIRNPLPLTYYDEIENGKKVRYWCWATYNNCLVENYYDTKSLDERRIKNIVMPSYGISSDYTKRKYKNTFFNCGTWTELYKYDLQNKWIWEELLGYHVILLRQDYNPFTRRQGSLNCLTNCIERQQNFY